MYFFLLILSVEEPVLREFSFLGNENVLRFERKTNTSRFGKAHMVAPDLESEVDKENKRELWVWRPPLVASSIEGVQECASVMEAERDLE